MLTIVNQQPDVTALQVQHYRQCVAYYDVSCHLTEQGVPYECRHTHVPATDESEQVKNSNGQWIDAEPVEGAFVCNIGEHSGMLRCNLSVRFRHEDPAAPEPRLRTGDMLRVMSAGLYQPTPHRVINTSGSKTRTSVAFFYEPVRPAHRPALCAVVLCRSKTSTA